MHIIVTIFDLEKTMDNDNILAEIKDYFLNLNKALTLGLTIILISLSVLIWYTGTVTLQQSSMWIGLAFMLLALLFYKLPHISFLITRRHFSAHTDAEVGVLANGWGPFKSWIES